MRMLRRGWRNLFRNRGRTGAAVLLLGLSVGIFATMAQVGALTSARLRTLRAQVQTFIEVSPAGSAAFEEAVELFPEAIVDQVRGIPQITRVDLYLITRVVDLRKQPTIAFFTGMAPDAPMRLAGSSVLNPPLIAGRGLQPQDAGKPVAVVGPVYARQAGVDIDALKAGRRVHLTLAEGLNPTTLEVVGIFSSGSVFGDNQVIIPLRTAQRIFRKAGQVSLLLVKVDRVENVEGVTRALRATLGKRADVVSPEGIVKLAAQSLGSIQSNSRFGAVLAGFMGMVVVVFTMVLVVGERTREIGMFKAIGASDSLVIQLLLAEVTALAGLGGIVGLAIAAGIGPFIAPVVLGATEAASLLAPTLVLFVLIAALVFAAIGALYPLVRALRMDPTQAMRHQA